MTQTRIEKDSMGEFAVPVTAYYGAQTARAVDNFPVSGVRFPRPFILALGAIKRACAEANVAEGLLDETIAKAIYQAADEVIEGRWDSQFVVDIYQTGSGTSTNMNVNEVLSNRSIEIMGGVIGSKTPVHPNDHVNKSQSSNDVIPTAIHVAAALELENNLLPALRGLHAALKQKAADWDDIVKIGRTHLMDATPVRLGQEASGWARQVELSIARLESVKPRLLELAIGGTAVGTGINSPVGFGARVSERLAERFGLPFVEAENHFEAQGSQDGAVELANQLSTVATSLLKIANDVRWLSSGPRCGLGELSLPPVQPGSSIMPGKVNPVICEQLMMVAAQVIGNATTVTVANTHGNLDLNVMLPVMARNVLESLTFLSNSVNVFTTKAVNGLTANKERAESLVEWSMSMVTSLAPVIGYDNAAKLAKRAVDEHKTVRDLVTSENILPADQAAELLDARKMTEPGVGAGGE
ncbi:fumarate hydratase class II [Capsulimonas corticalis]|uniref:Fumarate hydratase class II n=1 Tax=Capsulimonas corticalis TaxID=2219043 RepID=A0A402CXC6_9BACT|nr:class II fumarate hydratase [Capsulimonas corticalis]BDI32374.1 fumarate hydratase class II [Capsulimonas corticalis]